VAGSNPVALYLHVAAEAAGSGGGSGARAPAPLPRAGSLATEWGPVFGVTGGVGTTF
jgi:hypothetical protein